MTDDILVTGALGNVGSEIVKCLLAQGCPVRAADPNPTALRQRFGADVNAVHFNFAHHETFTATFQSVKRMFLMRPPQISNVLYL